MALDTIQEELQTVNAAIKAILEGAQSYTINNQSVSRANLDTLFKRKEYLESRLAAQSLGGRGFRKRPVFEG